MQHSHHTPTHCTTQQHTATLQRTCFGPSVDALQRKACKYAFAPKRTLLHTETRASMPWRQKEHFFTLKCVQVCLGAKKNTSSHCNTQRYTATHCNTPPPSDFVFGRHPATERVQARLRAKKRPSGTPPSKTPPNESKDRDLPQEGGGGQGGGQGQGRGGVCCGGCVCAFASLERFR